ncbi:MAG: zinc ABC transporter substrate-binding protein [Chloroflexi bacterium]|nr:zinc ABC transporter substrate-binding protein [Chloroflexota bacterium]
MHRKPLWLSITLIVIAAYLLLMASCSAADPVPASQVDSTDTQAIGERANTEQHEGDADREHDADTNMLILPELDAVAVNGTPLKIVTTTSIIGDVVAQVGGDAIELTTLMGAGQDPHSYQPAARDLTAVSRADVIFVNGWDLEEGLVQELEEVGEGVPVVAISANITPLAMGEDEHEQGGTERGHDHSGVNPHVWFSINNVEQWVENTEHVFSDLDPANAETYESNATAYLAELDALQAYVASQLAGIPPENRFLVTNHDALGYFVQEYDFALLGTVIPGVSTLAEPSAGDLAGLIEAMKEHGMCTIFSESTVSDSLAQTVAAELNGCDKVQVLPLYTGAIGAAGSGADSYIGMFRANVDAIVAGLRL